jgi:gluconokinase
MTITDRQSVHPAPLRAQLDPEMTQPYLIISMGVSGSGKSTLAKRLAEQFDLPFFEADDFHSAENKAHMAAGKPLTDAMREPWIAHMCDTLKTTGKSCVLAYSGLRRAHRQRFRELGFKTLFLHLHGEKALIAERMQARANHFMPSSLLANLLHWSPPIRNRI